MVRFAWAIDSGPVQEWDVSADAKIPLERRLVLQDPDVLIYALNSHFHHTVLNHAMQGVDTQPLTTSDNATLKMIDSSLSIG